MATSGSFDFRLTRDDIIQEALELLGIVPKNAAPLADDVTSCARSLNLIVKNLQTDGIRLWTIEEKTKTFTASDEVTGTDGNVYTCIKSHTSATANKPVTGADYTSYWIQRGETGGVWATPVVYSNIGEFTVDADCLQIDSAIMRDGSFDYPVDIISYSDYMQITDKAFTGRPTKLVFDKQLLPRVILWPIPSETDEVLHYLQTRMLEDFDASANNPDTPASWDKVLVWLLAADKAMSYGVPISKIGYIEGKAEKLLKLAKRSDKEIVDSEFTEGAY